MVVKKLDDLPIVAQYALDCEGCQEYIATIWCLCYKTNELNKKGEKRATGRVK